MDHTPITVRITRAPAVLKTWFLKGFIWSTYWSRYSPNGVFSSLDTNICDPWQTKVFLEAIFGGVTADKWVDVYLRSENVKFEFLSFLPMSIFRCSHCLPDCESTIYTSSVSATPLRRCWPWWWWWLKSPTPAWCPSCLSKIWPSLTLLTMIILASLGILSDGPGVTRRTLVWRCSASLTAMFLFLLSGRTRC